MIAESIMLYLWRFISGRGRANCTAEVLKHVDF